MRIRALPYPDGFAAGAAWACAIGATGGAVPFALAGLLCSGGFALCAWRPRLARGASAAMWIYVTYHVIGTRADVLKTLFLFTLVGLPISYGTTPIFGGLLLLALRELGPLTPRRCVVSGPILGAIIGVPIAVHYGDSGFVLLMAVLGTIASTGVMVGAWLRRGATA